MKRKMFQKITTLLIALLCSISTLAFTVPSAHAAEKYKVCWSRYVGWEIWGYIAKSGILEKWAKRQGIQIELVFFNDYVESINQFTDGSYVGCTMTNIDALNMPCSSGRDTLALIPGDYSNGNDGVVLKGEKNFKNIKGRKVKLVKMSVSHFLLYRGLMLHGMTEHDMVINDTSDADIQAAFTGDRNPNSAVVTWNPMLMAVRNVAGAHLVFDSSQIPGEIIDFMMVHADAPASIKKALVGAWYEAIQTMRSSTKKETDAINFMAKNSGITVAEFQAQMKTTHMFYTPQEAMAFTKNNKLKITMEHARKFSLAHKRPAVGIMFPDKTVLGEKNNVKLRFDTTYIKMAAEGKL